MTAANCGGGTVQQRLDGVRYRRCSLFTGARVIKQTRSDHFGVVSLMVGRSRRTTGRTVIQEVNKSHGTIRFSIVSHLETFFRDEIHGTQQLNVQRSVLRDCRHTTE